MISISIVGKVSDRPFRPGNGQRVVLKVDADDDRGRTQHLECDAFSEIGDWVMKNVTPGEVIALNARLETRTYRDQGEEVEELRIVAMRIEPLGRRGSSGGFAKRSADPNHVAPSPETSVDHNDDDTDDDDPNAA
jgi:single-stranded DNA-binding protein